MSKNGSAVTIIDGLEEFTERLLKSKNNNPWKESTENLSGNSFVIPMSQEVRDFGLCIGRILGLNLHEGYVQHSKREYFIKKHNHENDLHGTYVLFYLWNDGNPGYINLYEPYKHIERATGRMIVIPEDRYHSVSPIEGENIFLRLVFTKSRISDRSLNKPLIDEIRSKMRFGQA